tara:strand:- start:6229 stop:6963 length:735 start_codon:yes stop_codon:yes gene_type:complete
MKNDRLLSTLLDIAAMKLDFPVTDEDLAQMAEEIDAIPNEHWYWCTFRESYLICLYGNEDVNNKKNMDWLPYTKDCKSLRELCNNFIFPMTDIRPRIIIIRTMPGMKMRHHTDCYADQLKTLEPKLRLVLKGRENNPLYYIDEKNNRVPIPNDWTGYLMSGAALHGMDNNGDEKYTLCWGDPWVGDNLQNTKFVAYITEQINKHEATSIKISSLGNVDHAAGIKNPKKERIYDWHSWKKINETI